MPEWEHLVIRALGSTETELTVLRRRHVSRTYVRIQVADGGLLTRWPPFPTMWLRLWFDDNGRSHQRAFTVVDPEPAEGKFWLEFALHEGVASDWARTCVAGDTIGASLLGSAPPWELKKRARRRAAPSSTADAPAMTLDAPWPGRTIIVGDPASLPAVNSMLERLGDQSAEVWLEHLDPRDHELPVTSGPQHRVRWVHRDDNGPGIAEALTEHWDQEPPTERDRVWIAVEAAANRQLTSTLRTRFELPKNNVCATAYWRHA